MLKLKDIGGKIPNKENSISDSNKFLSFFDSISKTISDKIDYLNLFQDHINDNKQNRNLNKIFNSKSTLVLSLNEENSSLNISDAHGDFDDIELNSKNFPNLLSEENSKENNFDLNIFDVNNPNECIKNLNIVLYHIYTNKELGTDLNWLNLKLLQSIIHLKNFESSLLNFIEAFEKINFILFNNCNNNFHRIGITDIEKLNFYNLNDFINNETSSLHNYEKFSLDNLNDQEFNSTKKPNLLSLKKKKPETEKAAAVAAEEEDTLNKPLHFRRKRDYELKRKRIIKPKVFKIEKISSKRLTLRTGSKKYILKRIQYCWKSYFLRLILKLVPRRYDVIISKKFYQDHTKGFYLQLFKRLNSVKDLIADVICLHKRSKEYKRKALNLKNMGEFIKEIQITPEIKAFNYKLLDKIKMKVLSKTIQMNMVQYFRSNNYKKRIEVYNCKRYDDVDLIKFKKPIKFFYSFVFKDFKFSIGEHEAKRSIFYTDNLLKNRKNLINE